MTTITGAERDALLARLDERLTAAERAGIIADGGWFGELARTKADEHAGFLPDLAVELGELDRRDPVPTAALAVITWWVEGYPELRPGADLRGERVADGATTWDSAPYTEPEPEPAGPPVWVLVMLAVALAAECALAIALGSGAAVFLAFGTAATGFVLGLAVPLRR